MSVYATIEQLIYVTTERNLIDHEDHSYVRNRVMYLLKLTSFPENVSPSSLTSIPELVDELIQYAVDTEVVENVFDEKEILKATMMDCFTPLPSVINDTFYELYENSPEKATTYFYELSKNNNYIQTEQVKKNIHFPVDTSYGTFDITINLSKPEKDPEQIKRERAMKPTNAAYPLCVLCKENVGYAGRIGHPARANHRVIPVPLLEEKWYLQYSPYVYYDEHSILLSEKHRPMKIDCHTFTRLLGFVEKFPHYFIGSNADLPIVGGSILNHDHYQAGRYKFAMTDAEHLMTFSIKGMSEVTCHILKWPLSVIRLQGKSTKELVDTADHILSKWKKYSDQVVSIKAFTDDIPHNTITPIARKNGGLFELDLVLRNNRTTDEYPLGIFHPHEDVQHIKKENIGLIEVLGLAVLPARLKEEVVEIVKFLKDDQHHVADYHQDWANYLHHKYDVNLSEQDLVNSVHKEIGYKFERVLEDAGVFKQTTEGIEAFKRFVNTLST